MSLLQWYQALCSSAASIIGGMQQKAYANLLQNFLFLAIHQQWRLLYRFMGLLDTLQNPAIVTDSNNIKAAAIGSFIAFIVAMIADKFLFLTCEIWI